MSLTRWPIRKQGHVLGTQSPSTAEHLILNGSNILIIQFISLMSIVQDIYLHWVA
jgi:hypothetical protein